MPKYMFVTVGMSLYHSACWDDEFIKEKIGPGTILDDYKKWTTTYRNDPRERESMTGVVTKLKEIFTKGNAKEFADHLCTEYRIPGNRFSAELSTMLHYAQQCAVPSNKWKEFLLTFERIYFLCDTLEQPPSSLVVAAHHAYYLNKILQPDDSSKIRCESISGLSSTDEKYVIDALKMVLKKIGAQIENRDNEVVIITSGGYKIHGNYCFSLAVLNEKVTCVYKHERSDSLVISTKQGIRVGTEHSELRLDWATMG